MKKIGILLFVAILLTGCVTTITYDIRLKEVERPLNINERYGETKVTKLDVPKGEYYIYENEFFKVLWKPFYKYFDFTIENKTNFPIRVIWDESAYIDENNKSSSRLIHGNTKFIRADVTQVPSVVSKKSIFNTIVVPADYVYWASSRFGGGEWATHPLFQVRMLNFEVDAITSKYIGKTIKILLPIEIQGMVNDYIFAFKIEDYFPKFQNYY